MTMRGLFRRDRHVLAMGVAALVLGAACTSGDSESSQTDTDAPAQTSPLPRRFGSPR
jgi:hypothetical protein